MGQITIFSILGGTWPHPKDAWLCPCMKQNKIMLCPNVFLWIIQHLELATQTIHSLCHFLWFDLHEYFLQRFKSVFEIIWIAQVSAVKFCNLTNDSSTTHSISVKQMYPLAQRDKKMGGTWILLPAAQSAFSLSIKGIFRCKFHPWSNIPWNCVRLPLARSSLQTTS